MGKTILYGGVSDDNYPCNPNYGDPWKGFNCNFGLIISAEVLRHDGTARDPSGNLASFKDAGLPFNPKSFINDRPYARRDVVESLKFTRDDLKKTYGKNADFILTGGYGPGHDSKEHTIYGTAVDIVPAPGTSWEQICNILLRHGFIPHIHGEGPNKHIHAVYRGDYNEYLNQMQKNAGQTQENQPMTYVFAPNIECSADPYEVAALPP